MESAPLDGQSPNLSQVIHIPEIPCQLAPPNSQNFPRTRYSLLFVQVGYKKWNNRSRSSKVAVENKVATFLWLTESRCYIKFNVNSNSNSSEGEPRAYTTPRFALYQQTVCQFQTAYKVAQNNLPTEILLITQRPQSILFYNNINILAIYCAHFCQISFTYLYTCITRSVQAIPKR